MAALIAHAFNIPVPTDPNTQRSASFSYLQGLLTGVTSGATTYGTLSYYPNLLVSQVSHGNGVTEMQTNDPNEMSRPASLSASGSYASWSSGTYGYDGAGNIKTIGSAAFTYDSVSRLVASSLYDGPTGAGNLKQHALMRRDGAGRFLSQPFIKIGDRRVENPGDLVEPASRNAIDAAFVFVRLLIRNADHLGKLLLGQPQHDSTLADARSDMVVDRRRGPAPFRLCHARHL